MQSISQIFFVQSRFSFPTFSKTKTFIATCTSRMASTKTSTSEVGIANRLWIKFHKESIQALYNPFVLSLASGTLSLDSFRHYISQDFHFLKAFAQA